MRVSWQSGWALLLGPAAMVVAGCGGHASVSGAAANANLSIHASATHLDTNKTTRITASLDNGQPARVEWTLTGGDPRAGAGTISADGVYTPPSYLTRDAVDVQITAVLAGRAAELAPPSDSATVTVTPGFLQPLTPGNLAIAPGGAVKISGSMTEVGGSTGIRFAVASDSSGTPSSAGALSAPRCVRGEVEGPNPAYTVCSVTYTAPAAVSGSESVYVVGSIAGAASKSWTRVLVNAAGISSNPTAHQSREAVPVALGSSSGSNVDYDANLGQLTDCCGGTLGALVQDASGNQYVLSNNHVFARSDQALGGETIVQPGLIDNGCTPYGVGPGTTPVATLTGYPALGSAATNVDAAIARVTPGLVDSKGSILELGAKQADGTLAAAPPGISSTGGKGEPAALGMMVAKSGRTTGLTCAAVSAIDVDVTVDYFTDCAETTHAMTKTFTNQIAMAGTDFSDAGDSGALVVNTANAEPVGLFFAGGTDGNGVEHAIASPVGDVLANLAAQVPVANAQTSFSFVGGADHSVSCLNYDADKPAEDAGEASAAFATLPMAERERAEAALGQAQLLVNPTNGIARVGLVASKDHSGQGAIAFYVEGNAAIPAVIGGVATAVLPASESSAVVTQTRAASLNQAIAAKQRNAAALMKANAAIFGVGVGQSLDNPGDAALVLFVDHAKFSGKLPTSIDGQRVRTIVMDRLHVTRAHGQPAHRSGCLSGRPSATGGELDFGNDLTLPE